MEHLMKRAALVLATASLALAVPPDAGAHHSFAETYFENKVQRIEGNLVQFLYRSPHSYLHLAVTDDAGTVQRWAVEWTAGQRLTHQGVTQDTLRAGDHLIIEGNPGRNPEEHRLRMRSVTRPSDGWSWSGTFQ
jgi:hypothetical protein